MSTVKIIDAMAHKLEPGSKYVIFVDKHAITEEDVQKLNKQLGKVGMQGVIVMLEGDPSSAVIVEAKENHGQSRS